MAYFKIVPPGNDGTKQDLIEKEIHYILKPQKHVRYYGGYNVLITNNSEDLIDQFHGARSAFGKFHGIQVRHFVLSFSAEYDKVHAFHAYLIGHEVCKLFQDYQAVYAVHEETEKLHIHFIVGTVNLRTGMAFDAGANTLRYLHSQVGEILRMPGLWLGEKTVRLLGE